MPSREVFLVLQPEGVRLPANLTSLERFRKWARSDRFPERGRIDWLEGEVMIDVSPGDLNTHGSPKSALSRGVGNLVEESRRGVVYIDRARLTEAAADLSCEPDVVVVLFESIRAGRVRVVPRIDREAGRFVEIQGAADLVIECVSDSSVRKDTELLPRLYHAAGVREYWLVDARGSELSFRLHGRGSRAFRRVARARDGFVRSSVLGCSVRIVRVHEEEGLVLHRLESR